MATTKPHDSDVLREAISAGAADWIEQFIKHFHMNLLDASRGLPPDSSLVESQAATAQAILATYLNSGMELESAVELLGQATVSYRSVSAAWSDALNQRRFELIDKEIQESITPAEKLELAGLTKCMRDHVESETNLPMEGARALHRKLLQLQPAGESE